MPPEPLFDISQIDFDHVVATREDIRSLNPQRFEMEHLDGVLLLDEEQALIVGYKDVRHDEFWVRGHMPGYPLLPGVLMCEAAAQLCSFYVHKFNLLPGDFLGFLGLENVRFRGPVHPGERLVLVSRAVRVHRRQSIFNVQGFVRQTMVFQGDILGVPLMRQPIVASTSQEG